MSELVEKTAKKNGDLPEDNKEKQPRHYWQWFWDYDYLGNKYKAIYYGPKLDWMNVYKEKKKWKKK